MNCGRICMIRKISTLIYTYTIYFHLWKWKWKYLNEMNAYNKIDYNVVLCILCALKSCCCYSNQYSRNVNRYIVQIAWFVHIACTHTRTLKSLIVICQWVSISSWTPMQNTISVYVCVCVCVWVHENKRFNSITMSKRCFHLFISFRL